MKRIAGLFGTVGCGIETAEDRIRCVWLWKAFGRVRFSAADEEPVRGEEGVFEAVRRLLSRAPVKAQTANIRIPPPWVRIYSGRIPVSQSESIEEALVREAARKMPSGAAVSRMLICGHVLNRDEKGVEALTAVCPEAAFRNAVGPAREAGMRIGRAGVGDLDAFLSFAFDPSFLEKTICHCTCEESGLQAVISEKGALRQAAFFLQPESGAGSGRKAAIGELRAFCSDWESSEKVRIDEIVLAGQAADACLKDFGSEIRRIRIGPPLSGLKSAGKGLDPAYATAAGLAVKELYPFLNTLNLMPQADIAEHRAWTDKNAALRFILHAGGALCLVLAALILTRFGLQKRMASAEERMLAMSDRITALESMEREKTRLEGRLSEIRRLPQREGRTVHVLETLGRLVPPDLWLQNVHTGAVSGKQASAAGDSVLSIEGLAFNEQSLTVFLSSLENTALFQPVRLAGSSRLPADEAERMTGNRIRSSLVRFTVICGLPNQEKGSSAGRVSRSEEESP